jgi:hypothetical protein
MPAGVLGKPILPEHLIGAIAEFAEDRRTFHAYPGM